MLLVLWSAAASMEVAFAMVLTLPLQGEISLGKQITAVHVLSGQ